ncbi:DUF3344 domain-containing protein [Streptomyces sp. P9(2023)]|uniref:DUF3344 domain-containing protein n=1 Tax=Streptomyces sp. P9(2023) TaxID=3064394 RepID=UPI0028F436B4|nr:DUF3344 domain-containing protein [Streptomyces sp. P9(2023)]MDT9688516.1 DUF3344 domain-containing protein [Streptomyces sp. P9(2023)]
MRNSAVRAVRRGLLCALSCAALSAALPAAAAPQPKEAPRVPFAERYQAVQRGGIVRAADTSATATNSSSAELRVPEGSRVSYARLYSADVTDLVRSARSGLWTAAQVNAAMGRSAVGGWGGWTLVVAYENAAEPMRRPALWDGFETVGPRTGALRVGLTETAVPKGSAGQLGVVAHDGGRGTSGDYLAVQTSRAKSVLLSDSANSADDVMNSSITDFGDTGRMERLPAHRNTLGYDSDVFDLGGALRHGADRVHVRFGARQDTVRLGALFLQADVRR